jgi:hypothetical protein
METKTYRDWTITRDEERKEFMAHPTKQGVQHDYDQEVDHNRYCGNCLWNTSIEALQSDIDDHIIMEQEHIIKRLRTALMDSNQVMRHVNILLGEMSTSSPIIKKQITENENLLKIEI